MPASVPAQSPENSEYTGVCPACHGVVGKRPDGSLFAHKRYADGGSYAPGQPHEQAPCEGGAQSVPEARPVARIKGAGHREITWNGHTYDVYQYVSDYGDRQWMVDRDDRPCWAQCDTLGQARETIRVGG